MKWCWIKALQWSEFLIPICKSDHQIRSGWGQHRLPGSSLAEQICAHAGTGQRKSAGGLNPWWRQLSPCASPVACPVKLRSLPLAPLPCLSVKNVLCPILLINRECFFSVGPQLQKRCIPWLPPLLWAVSLVPITPPVTATVFSA